MPIAITGNVLILFNIVVSHFLRFMNVNIFLIS